MTQGSTWNIWEFHLHSPCSVLNNKFGSPESDEVWERYINQIEAKAKEKGVVAIGVTDYFTIEGYKRVVEFQKRGRLPGILVFPNIEFRADKLIYRSRGDAEPKRLNLHVIFSPDVRPAEIEEGFLHELDFVHESDPFEPATTRKLKISNLNEFGERLQNQHPKFKEQSPFAVGCMNAIIHAEQLKEQLDNRFRGRHLLVLADEDLSLLDWDSQHHAIRKQLVQMSHAILSSNEKTRQFCLGKTHDSLTAYLDEFKSLKPCIWGCDSHGFEERFMEPDLRRYCWIKAEVSWEGLKQILYEPEERVCIQEVNPEPDKSIYTLAAIEVSKTNVNAGLAVNAFNVEVNPNLVTGICLPHST